ncbi:FAD dependent oxidoreductase [Dendrothele bispora CBS 962.96]|uniref:FAD dependent oxidoreductase n=1 Tax=Dendrothele bispora (strain CBS 962.96) TaxID=1314807 RepID=A0A4S8LC95_DENBC|nr:FAD dependent oxidoreductase [Dendrothele bispora CBS 962.96]
MSSTSTTPVCHPLDSTLPFPGLPVPNPCLSFWQRSTRYSPLLNLNSQKSPNESGATPIPEHADVVIIGSGISGALTAYSLLTSPKAPKSVVMLEAREACSGASGRNAGHCRPDAFRGFTAFSKIHGDEQADEILKHEKKVLELVDEFVRTNDVQCDWSLGKTFDVVMGEGFGDYVKGSYEKYAGYLNKGIDGETRVPAALGAYEWSAASIHPAKLGQALLNMAVAKGLQLFTHSPVTSVTSASDSQSWVVHTPTSKITSPIVIHATNAFAATLIPSLKGKIVPVRAQAHRVIPTSEFCGEKMLTHTYSLRFSLGHFYSLIQRKADGAFILGTSRGIPSISEATKKEIFGGKNDTTFSDEIKEDALARFSEIFNIEPKAMGEGHEFGWTGVLGVTPDSVPFIGPVPSSPGQFVIAGFNGHGMARIFGCAPGLVKLILGEVKSWEETGMPKCFQITEERLAAAVN